MTWQNIYDSFKENPRDVKTNPKRGSNPRWFYVYSENGNVFIEVAREHSNSSEITQRRPLDKNNFEKMIELNDKRNRGFSVTAEATAVTMNQSYWYGILWDMQQKIQK